MSPAPMGTQFVEDFFVYVVNFTALAAAGGVGNGNIQIQADSDFKWVKSCYHVDIALAAQQEATRQIPLCTVNITDSASGRALMNAPVPVPSLFGHEGQPFILPIARIFKANSNIAIAVANFDAAAIYNLRLSFIGTKIFRMG